MGAQAHGRIRVAIVIAAPKHSDHERSQRATPSSDWHTICLCPRSCHAGEVSPSQREIMPIESLAESAMPRRTWMSRMSSAVMSFGLTLGYGMFGTVIGWFLYPAKASSRTWQFLTDLGSFAVGDAKPHCELISHIALPNWGTGSRPDSSRHRHRCTEALGP